MPGDGGARDHQADYDRPDADSCPGEDEQPTADRQRGGDDRQAGDDQLAPDHQRDGNLHQADHDPGRAESARRRAASQEIAIEVLGKGGSYGHAGQAARKDPRTIGRWMTDPVFAARVSERRAEWVSQIAGELTASGPDAVMAIRREMVDAPRPSDRLRAAALLLTLGHRFREQYELDQRLRKVETRVGLSPDNAISHDDQEEDDVV
jgi:hypothetical protein